MEGDFEFSHDEIKKKCFEVNENLSRCGDIFEDGLKTAFEEKRPEFADANYEKAASMNREERYQNIKEFSDDLLKKLTALSVAEEMIANIFKNPSILLRRKNLPAF